MNCDQSFRQSSNARVNLGLVGVGRWGLRCLSTLARLEGVHLSLVVSRNPT